MWMELGDRVINFAHAFSVNQMEKAVYVNFATTSLIQSYPTQEACDAAYENIKQYLINPI
jgi:hypothetical protein